MSVASPLPVPAPVDSPLAPNEEDSKSPLQIPSPASTDASGHSAAADRLTAKDRPRQISLPKFQAPSAISQSLGSGANTPTAITPRPLATAPPAEHVPSPVSCGPLNGTYSIPPRPKPGRKPATDEPHCRRKAQNREAQRNFRARKAAKIEDLEKKYKEDVDARERELRRLEGEVLRHQNELRQRDAQLRQHEELIKRLQEENEQLKASQWRLSQTASNPFQGLSRENSSHKIPTLSMQIDTTSTSVFQDSSVPNGPPTPPPQTFNPSQCCNPQPNGECKCVDQFLQPPDAPSSNLSKSQEDDVKMQDVAPTIETFEETEIDFTNWNKPAQDNRMSIADLTHANNRPPQILAPTGERQKSAPNSGPGTCDRCMADPAQRAWCMGTARNNNVPVHVPSREYYTPNSRTHHVVSLPSIQETLANLSDRPRIGCRDAYPILSRHSGEPMEWTRMRATPSPDPPHKSPDKGIIYSALEIESAEILKALNRDDVRGGACGNRNPVVRR